MAIWKQFPTVDQLNEMSRNTAAESLGIEMLEIGEEHIRARMPVDRRTHQPAGILHGGASVVLAETLGSIAAMLTLDPVTGARPVGLEINANHVRPVSSGYVFGTVRPIHVGRTTHVWDIRIEDERAKLVCASRLTIAIVLRS